MTKIPNLQKSLNVVILFYVIENGIVENVLYRVILYLSLSL